MVNQIYNNIITLVYNVSAYVESFIHASQLSDIEGCFYWVTSNVIK